MNVPAEGGAVPVDKPTGPTSHDVVRRLRAVLGVRRVGHTGTLDPFASGLLLLCVGPATRLAQYLTGLPKTYSATFRLGIKTDSHDPEGEVVAESSGWKQLDRSSIEDALSAFRGQVRQRPPAFSAKKVRGEAAHRRVRRGETVELPEADVRIDVLEIVGVELPYLHLEIGCSSGTYIRALARDLGDALGVGAHVAELRRVAVGAFHVGNAVPLDRLDSDSIERAWLTPAEALAHLPRVLVSGQDAERLARGLQVGASEPIPDGGEVAVLREDRLVAVATAAGGLLRPRKVFV